MTREAYFLMNLDLYIYVFYTFGVTFQLHHDIIKQVESKYIN